MTDRAQLIEEMVHFVEDNGGWSAGWSDIRGACTDLADVVVIPLFARRDPIAYLTVAGEDLGLFGAVS